MGNERIAVKQKLVSKAGGLLEFVLLFYRIHQMLGFFRTYQKSLFAVVSFFLIISFLFFGVQNNTGERLTVEKDSDLGTAIDGTSMREKEINHLKRFLQTDNADLHLLAQREMPNMFNDGVIRKDIVERGIAKELFSAFAEELKEQVSAKLVKHKRFRPYKHSLYPSVSVEGLWEHIAPDLKAALSAFKAKEPTYTDETLDALLELYEKEQSFPPHMVAQFMQYQAYQIPNGKREISEANFALFRARRVSDWFGDRFVELAAQIIYNGAKKAQQEGYTISFEEARSQLQTVAKDALKKQSGKEPTGQEFDRFYHQQLQHLGMQERDVCNVMRSVMSFRRLLDGIAEEAVVSEERLNEIESTASKKVEMDVYTFATPLSIETKRDMIEFQAYLNAVTPPLVQKTTHILDLPQTTLDVEKVVTREPNLVEKIYSVAVAQCTKEDALAEIPMQDVLEKLLEPTFYASLRKEVSQLSAWKGEAEADRLQALDGLSDTVREMVEKKAREALFTEELLAEVLTRAPKEDRELAVSFGSLKDPLPGISNHLTFMEVLEGDADIYCYTQDNKHYYTITRKGEGEPMKVLTFAEAREKGVIQAITDAQIKSAYDELKKGAKDARFLDDQGNWKPMFAVSDAVGEHIYHELFNAVKGDPSKRFLHYFEVVAKKMAEDPDACSCLYRGEHDGRGAEQWSVKKQTITHRENGSGKWFDPKAFTTPVGVFAAPLVDGGTPFVYQVISCETDTEALAAAKKEAKDKIGHKIVRDYMQQLVSEMKEKDAIHLSVNEE